MSNYLRDIARELKRYNDAQAAEAKVAAEEAKASAAWFEEQAKNLKDAEVSERSMQIDRIAEAVFVRLPHNVEAAGDPAPQLAEFAFHCAEAFADLVETRRGGKRERAKR